MTLTGNLRALAGIACLLLSGCASSPTAQTSAVFADNVPLWLGGMPKDVPPRPGGAEDEAWQAKRAEDAAAIKR